MMANFKILEEKGNIMIITFYLNQSRIFFFFLSSKLFLENNEERKLGIHFFLAQFFFQCNNIFSRGSPNFLTLMDIKTKKLVENKELFTIELN